MSTDFALPVYGSPPEARLRIPKAPALAGLRFHQQAFLVDPGVNPFGAVLSDAMTVVVGN